MKIASALFLSFLFAGAMPAPPQTGIPDHARVFIQTETPKGTVEIVVFGSDCIVRLDGGPWSSMIPLIALNALPPADGGDPTSHAGVTFCVSHTYSSGPMGMNQVTVTKKVEIDAWDDTLAGAVADAHQQIIDSLEGGFWKPSSCN